MGTLAPTFGLCKCSCSAQCIVPPWTLTHMCHSPKVFWIVVSWCINSSVVMQVQVNRISILVNNEKWKFWYKVSARYNAPVAVTHVQVCLQWSLAALLLIIDVVVCCTWLPVHLQVKGTTHLANALLPIGARRLLHSLREILS